MQGAQFSEGEGHKYTGISAGQGAAGCMSSAGSYWADLSMYKI